MCLLSKNNNSLTYSGWIKVVRTIRGKKLLGLPFACVLISCLCMYAFADGPKVEPYEGEDDTAEEAA
jgi:hypothetical protein